MGILQVRILEWVAMPSSRGPSQPREWTRVFYVLPALAGFFTLTFPAAMSVLGLSVTFHQNQRELSLCLSHVRLFATSWTITHEASLSMEFFRQEYWSGYSLVQGIFPTQKSNPGITRYRQILYLLSHQGNPYFYFCICVC